MKVKSVFSLIVLVMMSILTSCKPADSALGGRPTRTIISITKTSTQSVRATAIASPAVTSMRTPTQLPTSVVSPSITPTSSPYPAVAPTFPHTDVHLIFHGDRGEPYVALTFDMCQKPELPAWFDAEIVDALLEADAPATFFLGGDWMRTHPEETKLLAQYPQFELGNHSWSHPDMIDLEEIDMHREIVKTQNILYSLTGRQARLFRPPAGLYNTMLLSVVAYHGLYTIQWDADTADPVPDNDAENINRLVRERVQNGSIILMHGNGRGWHTAEALPEMIRYLRDSGYILVTVSQMIGLEPLPDDQL
jgi:peptidoglycan/xylan/chitin deacetylase (PgdA/CDA1 family)